MTTIYTHWTFLPYAIYTIATVMFAFGFYNMKKPFSLGATISPLLNEKRSRWINPLIDCICVFSLIAGLYSSLAVGVLNINGGLTKLFGVQSSPVIWALIIAILVDTFIISAITGIMKGIKILSDINTYIYIVIIAFILIFGGTAFICSLGVNSFGNYLTNFFSNHCLPEYLILMIGQNNGQFFTLVIGWLGLLSPLFSLGVYLMGERKKKSLL
jgi:choline-glycine betaine transporter